MKNTRIIPMRRLPGPADRPLCEGVKTPEAPVGLFRGWQRTQTQSSVRTLRSLRQQMDVWFCLMQELSEQESSAERHCCVEADPDQTNCAPSGARLGSLCFSLDFDLHRRGRSGNNPRFPVLGLLPFGSTSRNSAIRRVSLDCDPADNGIQVRRQGGAKFVAMQAGLVWMVCGLR
jgi:hypothetical protein